MVDPFDVTNFNRSESELQEFLLFSMAVAGKTASVIAKKIEDFLREAKVQGVSPFDYLRALTPSRLLRDLKKVKLGKYNVLVRGFAQLAKSSLDLETCSTKDLEEICGIGKKTSRFFLLHSRPNQRVACIDTHIKRWLQEMGHQCRTYEQYEAAFISEAERMNRDLAELDLEIWSKYARRERNHVQTM